MWWKKKIVITGGRIETTEKAGSRPSWLSKDFSGHVLQNGKPDRYYKGDIITPTTVDGQQVQVDQTGTVRLEQNPDGIEYDPDKEYYCPSCFKIVSWGDQCTCRQG